MVQPGEYLVLPHKTCHVRYFFTLYDFDGDTLKREFVASAVDYSEATLPDLLLKEVGLLDVAATSLQEHLLVYNQRLNHLVEILFRACQRTLLIKRQSTLPVRRCGFFQASASLVVPNIVRRSLQGHLDDVPIAHLRTATCDGHGSLHDALPLTVQVLLQSRQALALIVEFDRTCALNCVNISPAFSFLSSR